MNSDVFGVLSFHTHFEKFETLLIQKLLDLHVYSSHAQWRDVTRHLNFYKSSAVAEMGDRLAAIDMGRKLGTGVSLSVGGELGPHLKQCGLRRGLPV